MAGPGSMFGRHARRHILAYSLTLIFLISGIVFGTLATSRLSPGQKADLTSYLDTYIDGTGKSSDGNLLIHSLTSHGKVLGLGYLLGLTIIGAPGILVLMFAKGFLVGFAVGFMVEEYLLKGVVLSLAAVLPHNALALPAMVVLSVNALSFAWDTVRGPGRGVTPVYKRFVHYSFWALVVGGALVAASLVEAYVTPVFIGLASKFI